MASPQTVDVACRAKALYFSELQAQLEATNLDAYVAIEPDSKQYFLGASLSEAIQAARAAHPDRLAFGIRIGHDTALTIGVMS